jgi:hypothetical protein
MTTTVGAGALAGNSEDAGPARMIDGGVSIARAGIDEVARPTWVRRRPGEMDCRRIALMRELGWCFIRVCGARRPDLRRMDLLFGCVSYATVAHAHINACRSGNLRVAWWLATRVARRRDASVDTRCVGRLLAGACASGQLGHARWLVRRGVTPRSAVGEAIVAAARFGYTAVVVWLITRIMTDEESLYALLREAAHGAADYGHTETFVAVVRALAFFDARATLAAAAVTARSGRPPPIGGVFPEMP